MGAEAPCVDVTPQMFMCALLADSFQNPAVLNPLAPVTHACTHDEGGRFIHARGIVLRLFLFLPTSPTTCPLLPRFRVPATPVVGQRPVGYAETVAAAQTFLIDQTRP